MLNLFTDQDTIISYSSKQAEQDGVLFEITQLNPAWEKGIFKYITTNLLSKGYFKEGEQVNIPNILDLLNQANHIIKTKSNNFKDFDVFFSGQIELPNGQKQEIFIEQNETGKFTILLPEDH